MVTRTLTGVNLFRRITLAACATAALAATAAVPAPAAAAVPPDFVGVVSADAFATPGAYRKNTLVAQRSSGIGAIRQTFDWALIERRPGKYNLTFVDEYVADTARAGITVLPILFNPPKFHSSKPRRGAKRGTYPPRRAESMAAFAQVLVLRYGPNGSFWAENPEVPQQPIRAWQIWNEPNLKVYWPSGPNAGQYTALLKVVARKIHDLDPQAEVVTAGLPQSRIGIPLKKYVRAMYRAGAASAFDTLAVNPYARDARGVVRFLNGVRSVMDANGDRTAGIRATELGWSDTGPPSPFRVGSDAQAEYLDEAITSLARDRDRLGLRGFSYFAWRDAEPYEGGKDFWGLHTGLLDLSGSPKPALERFAAAARSIVG